MSATSMGNALLLVAASVAVAVSSNSQASSIVSQTATAHPQLVTLFFTTLDKEKRFVTDLTQTEIRIYEGGVEQQIVTFVPARTLPLTVGLLIDVSGSRRPYPAFEKEAAREFIRTVIRENDQAAVAAFADAIIPLVDFTADAAKLDEGIQKMGTISPYGKGAIYDSIISACKSKLSTAAGRRVLVLSADGPDNADNSTLDKAIETALHANVALYVVAVHHRDDPYKSSRVRARHRKEADQLTSQTGGFFAVVRDSWEATEAFRKIAMEFDATYAITYYSSNLTQDGKFRKLSFTTNRTGVKVAAPKGYYTHSK